MYLDVQCGAIGRVRRAAPDTINEMDEWLIHLSGWIIQDWNYPDFSRGQKAEFAVEYNWWEDGPRDTTATKSEAHIMDGAKYRVNARVISSLQEVSVLDIGLLVFHEEASPNLASW